MNEYFPNSQDSKNHTWKEFPSKMWACMLLSFPSFVLLYYETEAHTGAQAGQVLPVGPSSPGARGSSLSRPCKSWGTRCEILCPDESEAFNSAEYIKKLTAAVSDFTLQLRKLWFIEFNLVSKKTTKNHLGFPETQGEGFGGDILFRAENSKVLCVYIIVSC